MIGRPLALLAPLAALTACSSLYLFGDRADRSRFSHERHAKAQVECDACHDKIWDATSLGVTPVLPPEAKCLECHEDQKDKGNCGMCHTDPSHPLPWPKRDPELKLNHAAHLDRVKDDCRVCHKSLPEPGREASAPPMSACLGCHEHQQDFDQGRCDRCHVDLSRYPLEPISTFNHQGNWIKRHPDAARAAGAACANCHEQSYCTNCHETQEVPVPVELRYPERVDDDFLIHRGDWLSRHSIEAQADQSLCLRCHSASSCTSCHAAQNLTPSSQNPRNPHPPDWAFPGSTSHAVAARNDITSCQACHDQGPASNCIQCHKVGGIGGNPHPASFLSRHRPTEIHHNAMCLYCHP